MAGKKRLSGEIIARAAQKRSAHLKAQQETSQFTPAQRLMREELHPSAAEAAVNPPSREYDSDIVNGGSRYSPMVMGEALTELIGAAGGDPTDVVIDIINESPNLNLSFTQWAQVQRMMERAYRDGVARGTTFS